MESQDLIQEMLELLSEAAVEISNLDDRNNIVYRRLRAMQCRLGILDALAFESKPLETTIGEIADAITIQSVDVLNAALQCGIKSYYHDRYYFYDGAKLMAHIRAQNTWDDIGEIMVDLVPEDLMRLLQALELAGHSVQPAETPTKTLSRRKFSASETELPIAATDQQQRSG